MNILEGRPGLFERLHGEWLEIIAAVLLALATTASAWCAYQASRWHSEEALRFNEAMTARELEGGAVCMKEYARPPVMGRYEEAKNGCWSICTCIPQYPRRVPR